MRSASTVLAALVVASLGASAEELPINLWVELPVKTKLRAYEYAEPVYVPSRGQLLHWGAIRPIYQVPTVWRNEVRAFDADAGDWTLDYPPAEKLPGLVTWHSFGKGVSLRGSGEMLDCRTPAPSMILNGASYDSKRNQVVVTMKGLMAAYGPHKRIWRNLEAKTIVYGKEYPGGPPVYGVGTCYDPVNDEILLFPHWSGEGDPRNVDLRDVTGSVCGHLGTFRYRFADNTWQRVGDTFGSEEVRKQRREVIERMGELSHALDEAWRQRKPLDPQRVAELRSLETRLDGPLRVEPPPRCTAPMVYDPERQVIVLFGGHSGLVRSDIRESAHLGLRPSGLNDTWLYECATRQWRVLNCARRPPTQRRPRLFYDPASGLVWLLTFGPLSLQKGQERMTALWSLDTANAQWQRRGEQEWPWPLTTDDCYASRTSLQNVGFDPEHRLLVVSQNLREGKDVTQHTYVLRLDAGQLPAEPAPEWRAEPPIVPQTVPPDDPQWVAKLKALPPNRWVRAEPPREARPRDWGNLACDPVRGWVFYFGGGHSTYQVNDVAIYAVGANRWCQAAGDHNDFIPPVGWGGVSMGFRGGRHAHHQRNQYVAIDGRMYVSAGGGEKMQRHGRLEAGRRAGPRFAWFYDVDRGGVWRQQEIARVTRGKGVDGVWGAVHVVDPAGRILGLVGSRVQYYGTTFPEMFVSLCDVYANSLEVRSVPPPFPERWPECRPFCMLPDRNRLFHYNWNRETGNQVTWTYDVESNRFNDLKPKRQPPPGEPLTVEYIEGQDAVLAIINHRSEKRREQWVYSLKHNTWAELPIGNDGHIAFAGPYCQMVYVARYGVLVNTGSTNRGTSLMRPDLSQVRWE